MHAITVGNFGRQAGPNFTLKCVVHRRQTDLRNATLNRMVDLLGGGVVFDTRQIAPDFSARAVNRQPTSCKAIRTSSRSAADRRGEAVEMRDAGDRFIQVTIALDPRRIKERSRLVVS